MQAVAIVWLAAACGSWFCGDTPEDTSCRAHGNEFFESAAGCRAMVHRLVAAGDHRVLCDGGGQRAVGIAAAAGEAWGGGELAVGAVCAAGIGGIFVVGDWAKAFGAAAAQAAAGGGAHGVCFDSSAR